MPLLTSNEALRLIRRKEEDDARKKGIYSKRVSENAKFVLEANQRRQDRRKLDRARAKRHFELCNERFRLSRSINERRDAARGRTLPKKAASASETLPNGRTRATLLQHFVRERSIDQWDVVDIGEMYSPIWFQTCF